MRALALAALIVATTPAAAVAQQAELIGAPQQGGLLRGIAPQGAVAMRLGDIDVPIAPDRRFLIGFDRDAGPSATLTIRFADGRSVTQPLNIAPRAWRIERINTARRPGGASEDFLRRREGELAQIVAARSRRTDAAGWAQTFIWPATGRISGRFGSQRVYRGEPGSFHAGVDVAAGAGAPVVAPADGVVVLVAPPGGFSLEGNLVIIDHGMGLNSAYLHFSRADVTVGQRVRQGERIGAVGATGRATGPHLHWALVWNGVRVDPEPFAEPMR